MAIILCYKNNAWDFSCACVTIVFELQSSHEFAIWCWLRCQEYLYCPHTLHLPIILFLIPLCYN